MLRLFSVAGIPIAAHWSLLLAVGLLSWRVGDIAAGVVVAILLFTSVLLHELGHAFAARRFGLPIAGIDLHVFGGTAKMVAPPRSPKEEAVVAIAGPVVSAALGVLGVGIAALFPSSAVAAVASFVGVVNLTLFAFNLLPALPMDGGRVLRAGLASRMGFVEGTKKAVQVGVVAAVLVGVVGVVTDPWLLVMAFFIWRLGQAELLNLTRSQMLDRMGLWSRDPWASYRRNAPKPQAHTSSGAVVLTPDVVETPSGRVVTQH
jgi:Zn-dependent protease